MCQEFVQSESGIIFISTLIKAAAMLMIGVWVGFFKGEVKYQVILKFSIVNPWPMWVWLG